VARNVVIDYYRNKAGQRSTTLEEIENLPDNSLIIEKIESAQEFQQLERKLYH
jgi:DNA-directed RNA polymerase specialized sigma24 family protein